MLFFAFPKHSAWDSSVGVTKTGEKWLVGLILHQQSSSPPCITGYDIGCEGGQYDVICGVVDMMSVWAWHLALIQLRFFPSRPILLRVFSLQED